MNFVLGVLKNSHLILKTLDIQILELWTQRQETICQSNKRPYHLPLVHKELETLEKAGIIIHGVSSWASPLVVIPKQTFCGNNLREGWMWIIEP